MTPRTLFEKVWERHVVVPETPETPAVLYIDLHLTHEVTSPQAFDVLRARGLRVRRPDRTLVTMDHSTPTDTAQVFGGAPITLESARGRSASSSATAPSSPGPDRPAGRPARHRAHHRPRARRHAARQDHRLRRQPHEHARRVRALAFGIGTTEVGYVLATQCLLQRRPKTLAIEVANRLAAACLPRTSCSRSSAASA